MSVKRVESSLECIKRIDAYAIDTIYISSTHNLSWTEGKTLHLMSTLQSESFTLILESTNHGALI